MTSTKKRLYKSNSLCVKFPRTKVVSFSCKQFIRSYFFYNVDVIIRIVAGGTLSILLWLEKSFNHFSVFFGISLILLSNTKLYCSIIHRLGSMIVGNINQSRILHIEFLFDAKQQIIMRILIIHKK